MLIGPSTLPAPHGSTMGPSKSYHSSLAISDITIYMFSLFADISGILLDDEPHVFHSFYFQIPVVCSILRICGIAGL